MDGFKVVCSILVFIAVCQGCSDTSECGSSQCTDGYHAQCMNAVCACPTHHCDSVTKCPQGSGSGCPTFCQTSCNRGVCLCKCNGTL